MGLYRKYLVFLIFPPLLYGCVNLKQPSYKIHYYTLEYVPSQADCSVPVPVVIEIERFGVSPCYNTSRIIYRDGPFKRNAYSYHRWRANPGDLVGDCLAQDMRKSGLFQAVVADASALPSCFTVKGAVDEFFEWDRQKSWKAVLSLSITLAKNNGDDGRYRVLLQKTYSDEESCKRKNVPSMVEAMSRAMARVSERITQDVYNCLRSGAIAE